MKKIIILCFIFILSTIPCLASDAVYERNSSYNIVGWSVSCSDSDIDASYELVDTVNSAYAQIAAADTVEVVSSSAADTTQTVTVFGINSVDKKVSESIELNGATAVESDTTFKYIDQVTVDSACAGVVTLRRTTGSTTIADIPIGKLEALLAQHFNGEEQSYITGWTASVTSTTGTVTFELRFYPDDSKCLADTTGYKVLDTIALTNVLNSVSVKFPNDIVCSAGGWIAVYALGGASNSDGAVTVFGYDK